MNNQIQTASKLRDLAAQIALNFAGHPISSSDGSCDLLIQVIYDAMLQVDREARDDQLEACAQIVHEVYLAWFDGDYGTGEAFESAKEKIRALKSQ